MKKALTRKRTIALITGVGVALAIMVSQLFFFEMSGRSENPADTEQPEGATVISMPSVTLPSPSSAVETNQGFSFIQEILFDDPEQQSPAVLFSRVFDKLLQTLFRVVISPNAP
jgi:hypothetical protein